MRRSEAPTKLRQCLMQNQLNAELQYLDRKLESLGLTDPEHETPASLAVKARSKAAMLSVIAAGDMLPDAPDEEVKPDGITSR